VTPAAVRRESRSPAETEALGAELAAELAAGDVVLIEGELGAGKTTFVRGACRALGVTGVVTSPTFTIGQLYRLEPVAPGRGPSEVAHVDLYRVGDLAGEDPDLLADYLRRDTVAFVEWPQAAAAELVELAFGRILRVRLAHAGEDRRTVEIA
jgi:tRNA threonylcarbamoyladenosine biosynthesis protein TsaE